MEFDNINVKFKKNIFAKIKQITEHLYFGISVSDYIREKVITAMNEDENDLISKGIIKKSMSGPKIKHGG